MSTVTMRLDRTGHAAFEATSGSGGTAITDGSPDIGGEGRGMRPMEMLLAAFAGCTAMDVVHILVNRQKEPLETLRIEVEGQRRETVPMRFDAIHVKFTANRGIDEKKYQRAVMLSVEKYCSVRQSLAADIEVTYEAVFDEG